MLQQKERGGKCHQVSLIGLHFAYIFVCLLGKKIKEQLSWYVYPLPQAWEILLLLLFSWQMHFPSLPFLLPHPLSLSYFKTALESIRLLTSNEMESSSAAHVLSTVRMRTVEYRVGPISFHPSWDVACRMPMGNLSWFQPHGVSIDQI